MPVGKPSIAISAESQAKLDSFAFDMITIAITQDELTDYTMIGTGSDSLPPPTTPQPPTGGAYNGYQKIFDWAVERSENMTYLDGDIIVSTSGRYFVSIGWADFRHSVNNSTVGIVFAIERAGVVTFSQRPTSAKTPNLGGLANLSGGGTIDLESGDKLSAWVASNNSGTVNIVNANISPLIQKVSL